MTSEHVFYEINGYCPYLDKHYFITAEYAVIRLSRRTEPDYKLVNLSCRYKNKCSHKCPIEQEAKDFKP